MAKATGPEVRRVAVIGTGVIGAGWAARCLARGLDVVASDPAPGAEARLRAARADRPRPTEAQTPQPGADRRSRTPADPAPSSSCDRQCRHPRHRG